MVLVIPNTRRFKENLSMEMTPWTHVDWVLLSLAFIVLVPTWMEILSPELGYTLTAILILILVLLKRRVDRKSA